MVCIKAQNAGGNEAVVLGPSKDVLIPIYLEIYFLASHSSGLQLSKFAGVPQTSELQLLSQQATVFQIRIPANCKHVARNTK